MLKLYLRLLASIAVMAAIFPCVVAFFGLFFYEGPFSAAQVWMQVGLQVLLFTVVFLLGAVMRWIWE